MKFELVQEIKKLFPQEASVFSFEHQNNLLRKDINTYEQWIKAAAHAQMHFLEKNMETRKNATLILEGAKTAIIFLFPYTYGKKVRARLGNIKTLSTHRLNLNSNNNSLISKQLISKYIYGKDYHKSLKSTLNTHAEKLKEFLQDDFKYRVVVDSIPFFDRAHAREAGLGFIGKNTMLIRPGMGSFFFIATLLTTLPIEKLAQITLKKNALLNLDCGSCTKCLEACPTQALEKNYHLNANKCLSYLSIEHRDIIEPQFLPHFKDTIYGCDICQDVCPYNSVTLDSHMIPEFSHYHEPFTFVTALQIANMSKQQYEQWFGGTAATRAKYEGLVRNALYHLYATKHLEIGAICNRFLNSEYALIKKTAEQILLIQAHDSLSS